MSFRENDLKVIVLGDSGVGKTSLINVFITEKFHTEFKATLGADFTTKTVEVSENRRVNLQIWDTAGEERFHSVGPAFYRGTDCCILVFDLTNRHSFERLEVWRNSLIDNSGVDPDTVLFAIFANKSDLIENNSDQCAVTLEEAEAFANQRGIGFFKMSAKAMFNVENGFLYIAKEGIHAKQNSNNRIAGIEVNNEPKKNCC